VPAAEILSSKFWTGAVPLTTLALLLTILTNIVLGVPAALFLLSVGSVVCLSAAFTAQALAWGVFFKNPSWIAAGLALGATAFLVATARAEEVENVRYFGATYEAYKQTTKMFVPFLF